MTWVEDLARLRSLKARLERDAVLTPEQLEDLAHEAEALVRSARAALRRAEATANVLEGGDGTPGRER
jgi:hypothetical protein